MYCCYCFRDIETQADVNAAVFVQQTRYETLYACKECAPFMVNVILDTDLPEEL
jgi:hypothetical protein